MENIFGMHLKGKIKDFIAREEISFNNLIKPTFVLNLLMKYRYIHFLVIGASGVGLALIIIYVLTEFVFGREKYYTAYLIGLAINLLYNFVLHTIISFRTKNRHLFRFVVFVVYNLLMASLQAFVVGLLTPRVGVDFYIFVIAGVVFVFSVVNYLVFKFIVFFEKNEQKER